MSAKLQVPLLSDLAPDGFVPTGQYMVEFDADSLWYETSLTIAALALKQGIKTEYHVFDHFPEYARQAFSGMGLDPSKLEHDGLLNIWDSYTETTEFERAKTKRAGWESAGPKPLDIVEGAARWVERTKAGFAPAEKGWLHLDDNTGIFLQYNDPEAVVDRWRTSILPAVRARECPHFLAFPRGIATESFYTKFEAMCDGIIDLKTEEVEGRVERFLRVRRLKGKVFDSSWHRLEVKSDGSVRMETAPSTEPPRRLVAIVFTDLEGFTRLAQEDERGALALLAEQDRLLGPLLVRHHGRKIKSMGDGLLLEFPNARDAVEWGVESQRVLRQRNALGGPTPLRVRIGIHVGDVERRGSDILGDAVNVASRLEALAEAGGVCISRPVYDQIYNKLELPWTSLGAQSLKNVKDPLEVFRLRMPGSDAEEASSTGVDPNRLAILPLANFSPDPGDDYFADGLTDEIISTVSAIGGLSVISRTSVMRYKQSSKSMTEIGRELKAGKLLEGSVRKSGKRVRITVQLIDAVTDAHVWAKSYDGNLDDIFETQSDIARKIAEALKLPSPRLRGRPENPEVYALCLQARTLWNRETQEANDQAILLYQDALRRDPESGRASAGLSLCYFLASFFEGADVKEAREKAKQLATRAVELDETLAEAHLALGASMSRDDWPGAEVQYRKALELNPNLPDAHEWYGGFLRGMGQLEAALDEAKRAYDLDPLPPGRAWFLVVSYFFARRNDESLEVCNRLIQTEPGYAWAYLGRAVLTSLKGDREAAYQNLRTFRRLTNEIQFKGLQARIEAHLGDRQEASRLIEETLGLVRASPSPTAQGDAGQLSYAYALIGNRDGFFPFVEYLVDHKLMGPGELRDPSYENMVDDPRFADLFKKLRRSYGITS